MVLTFLYKDKMFDNIQIFWDIFALLRIWNK